jgi:hypothetical protein
MVAALCLVVIIGGGYVIFRPPARIDADPPAATPAGFKLVDSSDYRFAVPDSWAFREVTSEDQQQAADRAEDRAPGLGAELEAQTDEMDGSMTIAVDPVTRDNVTVIPYHWMSGDPSDPGTLEGIRDAIDEDMPGYTISGLSAVAADVHGFPAATMTYAATLGSVTTQVVSTVIQTGDHVYLLTVGSVAPERAAALSGQILPTFDPA